MRTRLSVVLFSGAFLLTGTGTALLGATLPATLHHFLLTDRTGGTLLLAGWGGSTGGALLARGRLDAGAAIGCFLCAAALFTLSTRHPGHLVFLYLAYGIGLGLTMTAISLLRSRQVTQTRVGPELNRLNLLWALGACATPLLALHSLEKLSIAALYSALALVFLALSSALAGVSLWGAGSTPTHASAKISSLPWAPLRYSLFAAASVGLESAIGGWLTTYTQRIAANVDTAVSANSAFWLGLLLSRALHSINTLDQVHTRLVRTIHLSLVCGAVALLLLLPGRHTLPLAGVLCGFGLGPLYPYVLSVTLPRFRSVAVFLLAGVGASVVPYLTGALSTWTGSLKAGMLVPAGTLALLIASFASIEASEPAIS